MAPVFLLNPLPLCTLLGLRSSSGKRQNQLAEKHINKIVETYQFRKEEDRYSKRVSMERIAEEGYNLNISRYISTTEQELDIDLLATHEELVAVEKRIREATAKHNAFLRELGLPVLPLAEG
ncbi:N-6 DNA methylase [Mesorhizobium sp. M1216]|uniref:N-6 DNA methylase n=1 Tax=Mesorhizobium sp. M1216 TaxID=2957069 RepID=UPI0033383AD5